MHGTSCHKAWTADDGTSEVHACSNSMEMTQSITGCYKISLEGPTNDDVANFKILKGVHFTPNSFLAVPNREFLGF